MGTSVVGGFGGGGGAIVARGTDVGGDTTVKWGGAAGAIVAGSNAASGDVKVGNVGGENGVGGWVICGYVAGGCVVSECDAFIMFGRS